MRKGFDTNCTDCGRVFNAPNRATLYCNVCRLSRNLIHFGVTTTKCAVCGDRFCPTRAKQVVCPKHYDRLPGAARHHVEGACRYCKRDPVTLYSDDVRVCIPCLHDPKQRRRLLKGVPAKAAQLKAGGT
jgi:hypothetical protein